MLLYMLSRIKDSLSMLIDICSCSDNEDGIDIANNCNSFLSPLGIFVPVALSMAKLKKAS